MSTPTKSEYLYLLPSGQVLYVSSNADEPEYASFRLFIGVPPDLRELPITSIRRLRDGGTTYITTPAGQLFSPGMFAQDAQATWNGLTLDRLDASDYQIVEATDTVTITPC